MENIYIYISFCITTFFAVAELTSNREAWYNSYRGFFKLFSIICDHDIVLYLEVDNVDSFKRLRGDNCQYSEL